MLRCMEAEAEGDVDRALEHYLASPHLPHAPQERDLRDLQTFGDDTPGWAWSRWILRQAYRSLLLTQGERIDDGIFLTVGSAYADVDPDRPMGLAPREFCTRLAALDWICEQLCLFEYDGLADFLELRASPCLVRRADRIDEWACAGIGGYRLDDLESDRIRVTDLSDKTEMHLLNIGAAADLGVGSTVIGRVVPISVAPGAMFAVRPLEVDPSTAHDVAVAGAAGTSWLSPLGEARESARLPLGFSLVPGSPLMTDVLPEPSVPSSVGPDPDPELPSRIQDLMDVGLGFAAANGVAVCEVGLIVAEVAPSGVSACAPHVATVLADPAVYEAAVRHCTKPGNEQGWAMLAECVAEPIRTLCRNLSGACRHDRSA